MNSLNLRNSAFDSMRSTRAMIDSLKPPVSALESFGSIRSILDSVSISNGSLDAMRSTQALIDSIKPHHHALTSLQTSLDVVDSISFSKNVLDSIKSTQSIVESFESFKSARSIFDSMKMPIETLESIKSFNSSLESLTIPSELIDTIKTQQSLFNSMSSQIDFSESITNIVSSGLLEYALEAIQKGDSIPSKIDSFDYQQDEFEIQDAIEKLGSVDNKVSFLNLFSKIPKPIQWILFFCLLHILLPHLNNISSNIISPRINQYVTERWYSDKDRLRLIKKMNLGINKSELSKFRFITGTNVRLRKKPSTNSKILDELDIGQIVLVKSKKKNWIEVMYEYEQDEVIIGWVFTTYTARFKN